jgi:hypothetical protein
MTVFCQSNVLGGGDIDAPGAGLQGAVDVGRVTFWTWMLALGLADGRGPVGAGSRRQMARSWPPPKGAAARGNRVDG